MGGISFVFAGQGDQFPGMGKELYDAFPEAKAVFDACEAIRPGTLAQCFEGTAEELQQTANTQPCLFAMEMAQAAVADAFGLKPACVAGFSLGEVSALTCAGAMDLATGFQMVARRGALMQQDAEKTPTSMAAVVKLTDAQVEAICADIPGVYPVNYNCPGQVTVAGAVAGMETLAAKAKEAGGRALSLKVRGGFHTVYMQDASVAFLDALKGVDVVQPSLPVYSDETALPYGEDVRAQLARQMVSPVRWAAIVRHMIDQGIHTFVEMGPGKTLSNMISKIDASVRVVPASDLAALQAFAQEVQG